MSQQSIHIALYHPRSLAGDGGITQSVRSLAKGLESLGYRVSVVFDGQAGDAPENWRGVGHRGWGNLRRPGSLAESLRDVDVVVFHSAWVLHNVVASRELLQLGIPYVLAPRGAYDPLIMKRRRLVKRAWWKLFEEELVQNSSGVHVFFESQMSHLTDLGYQGEFVVAPNGVSVPSDVVWDGGSSSQIVYVGRYDPEHKGLDLLVEGLAAIPEGDRPSLVLRGPDWRGGKARVESLVARLGLQEWVEVGPAVYGEEKWDLIRTSAGFVYPSRWEAFGNSPAQSASIGVPTLVTDYPLGRLLVDSQAGILAESSPEGLTAALGDLVAPSAAAIGQRGREVMRSFTWDSVSEMWGTQLEQVVKAHRSADRRVSGT